MRSFETYNQDKKGKSNYPTSHIIITHELRSNGYRMQGSMSASGTTR